MGEKTSIGWTDHTFNPWHGCAKVSPGCVNCYAESLSKRYGNDVWGAKSSRRFFGEDHWSAPLKWNREASREGRRHRVFCASMADVFEPRADLVEARSKLWELIAATPWLDWQLLTKRPEEVSGMVPWGDNWPENVWIGTSVENQEWADKRIPILLELPAIVRFLSCEPLIGPVDLGHFLEPGYETQGGDWVETPSVDWVICGGESGGHARRMAPEWARSLRDQCHPRALPYRFEGVPFLFKQTGAVLAREWKLRDAKGEDMAEWPADLQIREWPDPLGMAQGTLL